MPASWSEVYFSQHYVQHCGQSSNRWWHTSDGTYNRNVN